MGFLKEYYQRLTQLTDIEWQFISSRFEQKEYKKREIVTPQGEVEQFLFFVFSGIIRSYVPGIDKEVTFDFAFEKSFTSSYDSFITRTPSKPELQALTDTTVFRISHTHLEEVYQSTYTGNLFGRCIAQANYLAKSKRELDLLELTAEGRYLKLFEEEPRVIREIPLKYIASYLGITPQALSRIRSQIN